MRFAILILKGESDNRDVEERRKVFPYLYRKALMEGYI